jgi:hypothetical protein
VRDFLLTEALKRLAADAAVRLSALVAAGDQIPFNVAEQAGPDSLFHSYEPLTERFVHEREDELRTLHSFVPARNAVEAAGVAIPFLEARGETVPSDPAARAEKVLIGFVASLWDGCTEFSLDRERLQRAIEALDADARDADEAEVLIAPVVGLKMAQPSLQLPRGVRLIRADAIEAPVDAMRSAGMGRAAWEPQFLAVAEQDEAPDSASEALRQLRELISVMRLFKPGGIGLGPYAFAPTGEGTWNRLPTGAPATRPGGYRLSAEEAAGLAEMAAELEARPDPDGALSWAVARFEMGCARESAVEGLSDHLLALRAVLEGHGPVGASLPMRASALIGDESRDRIEAQGRVEAALELERAVMNGAQTQGAPQLASWVEESVRRLLRDAALGTLGGDLGATADESLIATGLAEGDAAISVSVVDPIVPDETKHDFRVTPATPRISPGTAQGSPGTPKGPPEMPGSSPADPGREAEESAVYGEAPPSADEDHDLTLSEEAEGPSHHLHVSPQYDSQSEEDPMNDDHDTRIMEPVPAEDEIRITATNWLDEVAVDDGTMEWAAAESDIDHRERIDSPRVRHLFQVPEDADWEVRELEYDHYRHAG